MDALTLFGVAVLGLVACCCCLCLCCLGVLLGINLLRGRQVYLDGTCLPDATRIDEEAGDQIEAARMSPFEAGLERVSRDVSRVLHSSGRSFDTAEGASGQLPFLAQSNVISVADSRCGRTAQEKRQELIQARREMFRDPDNPRRLPGVLNIKVAREELLEQSLRCVNSAPYVDLLARVLKVKFRGERGIDAGGLARDWFDSLGNSLVAAAEGNGHLAFAQDGTLTPRPLCEDFQGLYAIGRVAALAVWFGIPLPVPLSSIFCKFLLNVDVHPRDLQRLDPDFYQFRIEPVLRLGGVAELEQALGEPLMFVSAATELRPVTKELCPDGGTKRVTEENKMEYVHLLCEYYLCGEMREQISVVLCGFWSVLPMDMLKCAGLDHRELALLICGFKDLDPTEWREHSQSPGSLSSEGHRLMEWFWELVAEMTPEKRAKLLHFSTGSSRLPVDGFSGLCPRFKVSILASEGREHLPHSHTCANALVLPLYSSRQDLAEKLLVALDMGDSGFGNF